MYCVTARCNLRVVDASFSTCNPLVVVVGVLVLYADFWLQIDGLLMQGPALHKPADALADTADLKVIFVLQVEPCCPFKGRCIPERGVIWPLGDRSKLQI